MFEMRLLLLAIFAVLCSGAATSTMTPVATSTGLAITTTFAGTTLTAATSVPGANVSNPCTNPANTSVALDCLHASQRQADADLLSALIINVVLFAVFLLLFLLFRGKATPVYEPMAEGQRVGHMKVRSGRPTGSWCCGWLKSARSVSDEELAETRGLDAVMYLKTVKAMGQILALFAIFSLIVLWPVYATSPVSNNVGTSALTMSSLTDVYNVTGRRGEPNVAFVAPMISVVFNTIVANLVLFALYRTYVKLRVRYRTDSSWIENRTVFVRDIQPNTSSAVLRGTIDAVLRGQYVQEVYRSYYSKDLWKALAKRQKMGLKLEGAQGTFRKKGERPTTGCCGGKTDAIDKFQAEYDELDQEVRALQDAAEEAPTAFVVMRDTMSARLLRHGEFSFTRARFFVDHRQYVDAAPTPSDVHWEALPVSHVSRFVRSALVNIFTFLLIFFWMIPVGFVSALSTLENLSKILPWLVDVISLSPVLTGILQGFLPQLAIIIFMAILVSVILTGVSKAERHPSWSKTFTGVLNKFFLFLVINVFLGVVLLKGAFSVLSEILANPLVIIDLVASALPATAGFFISYVALKIAGLVLGLWRPGPFIVRLIFQRFLAKTYRAHRKAEGPYYFRWYVSLAHGMLIFIISTSFSTMAPLILPFGILYMLVNYYVQRYNYVYVYTPEHEGHGSFFPAVYNRLMASLVFYQVLVAGVIGIANFPASGALFAVVVVQVFVWGWTTRLFRRRSELGCLSEFETNCGVVRPEVDQPPPSQVLGASYEYWAMRNPPYFQVEDNMPDSQPPSGAPLSVNGRRSLLNDASEGEDEIVLYEPDN